MLIYQRDELALVECKNIEMEYMLALGDLEYKAYELNCLVLRLKRKAEMIRARINRQEKIILSDIESALDEEFADYQARLEEQINRMNAAIERDKCPSLSEEAAGELKKLYHAVVKVLHPNFPPPFNSPVNDKSPSPRYHISCQTKRSAISYRSLQQSKGGIRYEDDVRIRKQSSEKAQRR